MGIGASLFTSWATGTIKDATGRWPLALLPLAGVTAVATIAVILLGRPMSSVSATRDRSKPPVKPTTPVAIEP